MVAGYSAPLRLMRPAINLVAALSGRPRLPAIGKPVSNAFISHVACASGDADLIKCFFDHLDRPAQTKGIDYLTIGFDARDPRLAPMRKKQRARICQPSLRGSLG